MGNSETASQSDAATDQQCKDDTAESASQSSVDSASQSSVESASQSSVESANQSTESNTTETTESSSTNPSSEASPILNSEADSPVDCEEQDSRLTESERKRPRPGNKNRSTASPSGSTKKSSKRRTSAAATPERALSESPGSPLEPSSGEPSSQDAVAFFSRSKASHDYVASVADERSVRFVQGNSAAQILIAADGREASNKDGYRTARTNYGVGTAGCWYYEIECLPAVPLPAPNPHVRFGWSTSAADVQLPVGADALGFSYRDREPAVFHKARGRSFGDSWSIGDVLGTCFVYDADAGQHAIYFFKNGVCQHYHQSPHSSQVEHQSSSQSEQEHQSSSQSEQEQQSSSQSEHEQSSSQSAGGQCAPPAFAGDQTILAGQYYPSVSLYMGARVALNPGPVFRHPPQFHLADQLQPIAALVPPLPPSDPPSSSACSDDLAAT